ncbi:phosphotransferase [Nonomuraea sp. NPDC000554]|uniref:phosphotransferase n=1 Tax=Nonomuraea sp. NPDC000554 TaxID=3154259 RepID=UPI0033174C34
MKHSATVAPPDAAVITRAWARLGDAIVVNMRKLPGRSHRVYECVDSDGRVSIVRLADARRARFDLELALAGPCAEAGVPVPVVRHVGVEEMEQEAVAVMVQDKAAGETLSSLAGRLGPQAAAAILRQAGEVLASIHCVPTEGFGSLNADLRGPSTTFGAWFVDSLDGKLAQARRIEPDAGPILDQAMDLLHAHRDLLDDSPAGLAHGDFSPDNILAADGRVSAVIDWEAAKSGPPELDIGWWDCFFETPATPVGRVIEGYELSKSFDPSRLSVLRHLTVLRVMIGHFSWTLSVGDRDGVARAAERITQEVGGAHRWS